jgi:hypothetical protein
MPNIYLIVVSRGVTMVGQFRLLTLALNHSRGWAVDLFRFTPSIKCVLDRFKRFPGIDGTLSTTFSRLKGGLSFGFIQTKPERARNGFSNRIGGPALRT